MIKKYLYGKPLITPYNPKMYIDVDEEIEKLLCNQYWESEDEIQQAKEFIGRFYDITEKDGNIRIRNKEILEV